MKALDLITRYHNTHLTQKLRNNNLICITSIMKLGYRWEKLPIRSSAGERVENKETPVKIRSVGRKDFLLQNKVQSHSL